MKDAKFYWWKGSDMAGFFAEVQRVGLKSARIEFRPETKMLRVVDTSLEALSDDEADFNFGHVCPPDCP